MRRAYLAAPTMEFQLHHHGDVVLEYGLIGTPDDSVAIALHGYSLGGRVALSWWAREPERFCSLPLSPSSNAPTGRCAIEWSFAKH